MLVVLVFTLALTGLAVFSAKFAFLGEAVARNQLDQQVARQAAEAALRDAERDLLLTDGTKRAGADCGRLSERPANPNKGFDSACTRGQCGYRSETLADADYGLDASNGSFKVGEFWWPAARGGKWVNATGAKDCVSFTGGVPLGTFTGVDAIAAVSQQPEYMIEYLGQRNSGYFFLFRITARGFGYRDATQTVLQTYFLLPSDLPS